MNRVIGNGFKSTALALAGAALLVWGSAASAMPIDFLGLDGTPDPLVEGYQFSAGDFTSWADTFVTTDFGDPNEFLLSGADTYDIMGTGPDKSFINIDAPGVLGGTNFDTTISLDAMFDSPLPSASTLVMQALLGGTVVGSDSLIQSGTVFEAMSITLVDIAFDTVWLFDEAAVGDAFRIDNFNVAVVDNGGGQVPEPSALLLMLAGLAGLGMAKRRAKA
ncbi:MAG: PEP-CTERM sorting domain-containing protein [gamma proteobacterium endosymbiont of Lamellibrachia anaximandri]|nr:PEP-CTERM sorting domain-containing protein [gamma proteobacterium endosymbiont of Lamellibrachia anaximandri]MBL3617508.1 PEP-CTERM sorting domain-containing protein [gamma proteobacterium endosymbiont of Lamellibrachia anaximandri]